MRQVSDERISFAQKMNVFKKILPASHGGASASRQRNSGVEPVEAPHATKFHIDDYKLVRTLGTGTSIWSVFPVSLIASFQGSFGRVFMAKRRDDPDGGPPVAIKRLKKSVLIRQKQVDHILSERKVLGAVKHPFLVR